MNNLICKVCELEIDVHSEFDLDHCCKVNQIGIKEPVIDSDTDSAE
jgi:hypothetical protein